MSHPQPEPRPRAHDITAQLARWSGGDPRALDAVIPHLYDQLYSLARRLLTGERPDHTLGVTGLLHELYLELAPGSPGTFADRHAFFSLSACVMRRALIDHSRRHRSQRRGGHVQHVPIEKASGIAGRGAEEMIALDDALSRLESVAREKAEIVSLRFFIGMTVNEIAEILGRSERTVAREWRAARLMLRRLLDVGMLDAGMVDAGMVDAGMIDDRA